MEVWIAKVWIGRYKIHNTDFLRLIWPCVRERWPRWLPFENTSVMHPYRKIHYHWVSSHEKDHLNFDEKKNLSLSDLTIKTTTLKKLLFLPSPPKAIPMFLWVSTWSVLLSVKAHASITPLVLLYGSWQTVLIWLVHQEWMFIPPIKN